MTAAPTPLHSHSPHGRHAAIVLGVVLVCAATVAVLIARGVFDTTTADTGLLGSGVPATQIRALPAFGEIELAGSNAVVVRVGRPQSVVVHADDNLVNRVTTVVRSGRLVIGTKPGSMTTASPMRAVVDVPSLHLLNLSGSGTITATGVRALSFAAGLAGSGVLHVTGAVVRLKVTLDGSGDAQLTGLAAENVTATLAGSGRILVTATRSLDASVPGSGAVVYYGSPRVRSSVTGSGAVTHG